MVCGFWGLGGGYVIRGMCGMQMGRTAQNKEIVNKSDFGMCGTRILGFGGNAWYVWYANGTHTTK